MLRDARGHYVVAQTTFDDTGAVDLDSLDLLIDFYLRHGAAGFTVLGVSGEAGKLTPAEAVVVATRYIERAEGKPVIVGVSNPSLAQLRELTEVVMERGAAGVMIAPPGGLRTDEDVVGYFNAVFAQIGDVPTVLQDFPAVSGVWLSVPTILRLVETYDQIQVLKEEDLPSIHKIARLREADGRRIAILTGNNGMYLPLELDRGADGPMSGFSYPEMLAGVYALHASGRVEEAYDLFDRYLPLLSYEAQGAWGVAARKEVLRRRGAMRHATMRAPGPRLTPQDLADLDRLVRRVERAVAEAQP